MEVLNNSICIEGFDLTLLKKVSGFEPDNSQTYRTHKRNVPVTKFVGMDFSCDSLYDFQNAKSLIIEDEDEDELLRYKNNDKAEYLVIYKYGSSEQKIFPYTEKELMELVGMNIKRKTGLEGFLLNKKLCYSNQQYYINEVNKMLQKVKSSRGRKKKSEVIDDSDS